MGQAAAWHKSEEIDRLVTVRSVLPFTKTDNAELDALSALARDMFSVERAGVHIIDEDWLYVASQSGLQVSEFARDLSVCSAVVNQRAPLVVPDMSVDSRWSAMPYVTCVPNLRFYAGAPVELEDGVIVGSFCVVDTRPRAFADTEVRKLKKFAKLAGALLRLQKANYTMGLAHHELQNAAMTDPLTGFFNRKALDVVVDQQLRNALAENDTFGALYLDMDGFKSINDTFGHAAGDQVLHEAATRIRGCVRSQDTIVRMGGDEFAVFLPSLREPETLGKIAERLLDAFRQPFLIEGSEVVASLSIGGATAPQSGTDRTSLLRSVDQALYQAKKAGRNRFIGCAR